MVTDTLYEQTLMTSLSAGLPIIGTDTSARILAVVQVLGNNELIVLSPKVRADLKYISRRFHIQGGETPSAEIVEPLRRYVGELEALARQNKKPQWADDLFQSRYGISLFV